MRTLACLRVLPVLGVVVMAACRQGAQTHETVNSFLATAKSVVLCQTTEAELRLQLGEPHRDGILHGGRVLSWIVPGTSAGRYLAVLVDSRRIVTDLYWDIPTAVPWVPTDQCASRSAAEPVAGTGPHRR